ncbi:discoidin domain-containing protein [Desulfomarina sp.]
MKSYCYGCVVLLAVLLFPVVGKSVEARQNIERKIDTIIEVISPPGDDTTRLNEKKNALHRLLVGKRSISGNPLVDELLRVYLDGGSQGNQRRGNGAALDGTIDQIVDILNPHAGREQRRRQKEAIFQILNGSYKKKPGHGGTVGDGNGVGNRRETYLAAIAEVTVSDQMGRRFRGTNAIDGLENTEWVARGSRGKWLLLRWNEPVNIKTVGLQGRRQDMSVHIWSSDIVFSDGTILDFGALNPAQFREITVNKKGITWLKYYIREGQNNVGLSEIRVMGALAGEKVREEQKLVPANLARKALVLVSGSVNKKHSGQKAVDRNPASEWVAGNGKNQWLQLSWKKGVDIERIRLTGRSGDPGSRLKDLFLVFSDGAVFWIEGGLGSNQVKMIRGHHEKITWLKLFIRSARHKAGLAEIEVFGRKREQEKIEPNLAQKAVVRVSGKAGKRFKAGLVKDRRLDTQWVSAGGRDSWVALEWTQPVDIGTVSLVAGDGLNNGRIYDSVLILSDGSLVPVGGVKPGATVTLDLDRSGIWWIKFFVRDGRGKIGVSEIIVEEW